MSEDKDYRRGMRDSRGRLIYIGHYGCAGGDRIVKVKLPAGTPQPHWATTWTVDCPACGRSHPARPMWRLGTPGERRAAELEVQPQENEHSVMT